MCFLRRKRYLPVTRNKNYNNAFNFGACNIEHTTQSISNFVKTGRRVISYSFNVNCFYFLTRQSNKLVNFLPVFSFSLSTYLYIVRLYSLQLVKSVCFEFSFVCDVY